MVTPQAPVFIVFFREGAEGREYTSFAAIEEELSALQAGGGTSIRAGLQEAASTLERFKLSEKVEICLLTDGEDKDLEGIQAAQGAINKLLKTRHESNLSSTVLVRSWSNDPAKLSEPLVAGGVAEVLDLAKPVRVRCQPRLAMVGAPRWIGREDRVHCKVSFALSASGAPIAPRSVAVLQSDALKGPLEVPIDGAPVEATLDFRPGRDRSPASLQFKVRMPGDEPLPGIGKMTFDAPGEVELTVAVPERNLENQLEVAFLQPKITNISNDSIEVELRADFKPREESAIPAKMDFLVGREAVQSSLEKGKPSIVRLGLDQASLRSGRVQIPIRVQTGGEVVRVPIPHGQEAWSVRLSGQPLEVNLPQPQVRLGLEAGAPVVSWLDPSRDKCRVDLPISIHSQGDAWATPYEVSLDAEGWQVVDGGIIEVAPNTGARVGRLVLEGVANVHPLQVAITPSVKEQGRSRIESPGTVVVCMEAPPPLEVVLRPTRQEYRLPPWRREAEVEYVLEGAPVHGGTFVVLGPDGQAFQAGSLVLRLDSGSGSMPATAEHVVDCQPLFRLPGDPPAMGVRLVIQPVRLVREPAAYLVAGGLLIAVLAIGALLVASRMLRERNQPG
jgi:hypothetical protein